MTSDIHSRHDIGKIASVILAAGKSERFGGAKLTTDLNGKPIGMYCGDAVQALGLPINIAVCGPDVPSYEKFGIRRIQLDPAGAPMSRSIALGVNAARDAGAAAVMIILADMPLVPISHYRKLLAAFDGQCIASSVDDHVIPPALFGASFFTALTELEGDYGARAIIDRAPAIRLESAEALDIDTGDDLQTARRYIHF